LEREELAWAAGFFDGEGCFSYTESGKFACVRITQTEKQPLDRFARVVCVGKVYGPYAFPGDGRHARKPQYVYDVTGHQRVQAIIAMLWFKLGPIKRAQGIRVVERARQRAKYCKRGHLRPERPYRGCATCTSLYWESRRRHRSASG
jgi:hypothetical protein